MSNCKAHFETYDPDVPVVFVKRVNEWMWLMAHWSTKESKGNVFLICISLNIIIIVIIIIIICSNLMFTLIE